MKKHFTLPRSNKMLTLNNSLGMILMNAGIKHSYFRNFYNIKY